QWPLGGARNAVPGHAPLHSLRRLPQSLPGLSGGGRTRLRLGIPRSDGRGAVTHARRDRQGRTSSQRVHILRAVRSRLSDEDPAAEHDAALAGARVRAAVYCEALPRWAEALGVLRSSTAPLWRRDAPRHPRAGQFALAPRLLPLVAARRRLDP